MDKVLDDRCADFRFLLDYGDRDVLVVGPKLISNAFESAAKTVETAEHIEEIKTIQKKFDVVVVCDANGTRTHRLAKHTCRAGGVYFFGTSARYPFFLFRLKRLGFAIEAIYAPLPSHNGIPLFYVPLANGPMAYFFSKIMPLILTVSPEVKKQYGWKYRAAARGLGTFNRLKLSWLAKFILPSYVVVARRAA